MSSEAKTRSKKEDKPVTCRLCLITPWILFTFQERMGDFVTIIWTFFKVIVRAAQDGIPNHSWMRLCFELVIRNTAPCS